MNGSQGFQVCETKPAQLQFKTMPKQFQITPSIKNSFQGDCFNSHGNSVKVAQLPRLGNTAGS